MTDDEEIFEKLRQKSIEKRFTNPILVDNDMARYGRRLTTMQVVVDRLANVKGDGWTMRSAEKNPAKLRRFLSARIRAENRRAYKNGQNRF